MKLIKTYADLHYLHIRLYKYDVYRKLEKYKAAIPQWNEDENKRITEMINKYDRKYGRTSGIFTMVFVFLITLIIYFISQGTFANAGLYELIALCIFSLAGAVAGKLAGLVYARWQLIKFVHKIICQP